MTGPTHTVRNSLIDKVRTFTLRADALHWSEDGGQGELAYDDVRDMRLVAYASPGGQTFQCTLRGHKGGKVKLRSHHYESVGMFEDRTATYAPFVQDLARRAAAAAPDAKFVAGSTALWIVWLVVGVLCALVVVLLILSLFEGLPAAGAALVAIVICLAAIPRVWRHAREGNARAFDPAAPPPDLLGMS